MQWSVSGSEAAQQLLAREGNKSRPLTQTPRRLRWSGDSGDPEVKRIPAGLRSSAGRLRSLSRAPLRFDEVAANLCERSTAVSLRDSGLLQIVCSLRPNPLGLALSTERLRTPKSHQFKGNSSHLSFARARYLRSPSVGLLRSAATWRKHAIAPFRNERTALFVAASLGRQWPYCVILRVVRLSIGEVFTDCSIRRLRERFRDANKDARGRLHLW